MTSRNLSRVIVHLVGKSSYKTQEDKNKCKTLYFIN